VSNVLLGDIRIRQIPFPIHFSFVWPKITADSSTGHARWLLRAETIRCVVYGVLVSLLLPLSATADELDTERRIHFNIPQQRADLALTQFAEQASLTLLFPFDGVRERTANRLVGEYSVQEAIGLLLLDTGLTPTLKNRLVLDIAIDDETKNAGGSMNVKKKAGVGAILAAVFSLDAGAQEAADTNTDEQIQELDEIVVTGTTIRGVYPESAPLDVYTTEDIALSGATTVNRFLETLPQNVNSLGAANQALGPGEGNTINGGGVDLRGFGPGTTLVLLNGRRLTSPDGESPDTSLIPLGMVERVEVLADGASAIYGSDAIGGVVNFILRDDFEGVELSASYGGATRGGHDRFQADLAAGTSWSSGSGFISYSHSTQSQLVASERDFSSSSLTETTLVPDQSRRGIFGAIDQGVNDRLNLSGNIFYSKRESELDTTSERFDSLSTTDQEQVVASAALEYELQEDLFFQLDGTYLDYEFNRITESVFLNDTSLGQEGGDSFDVLTKVDGRLFDLPGGEARFSIGGGYSKQNFRTGIVSLPEPLTDFTSFERDSNFAFMEVYVPLISEGQGITGINRLELSTATRYTDYSDFGSASTPRIGVLWSPFRGLNLRSTYARGFRAPTLSELDSTRGAAQIFSLASRGFPDIFSSDDSSILLFWTGAIRDDLKPEFSDTITIGFDFEPESIENLRVSATYFSIDYEDRLGAPGGFSSLSDPEGFLFAFNQSPTLDDFEQIVGTIVVPTRFRDLTGLIVDPNDPAAVADVVTVVFDTRLDNLANSKSEGVDLAVDYRQDSPMGDLSFGLRATYVLESTQRAIPTSPEVSLLDSVGNPVSLKLRAYAGLRSGGFSGQVNVNHVDSYTNTTVVPEESIDSWTTVDLNLRYSFDGSARSLLQGTVFSLNVNNLFDQDPPFVAARALSTRDGVLLDGLTRSVGFDPVNANPLGRFLTVGLTKQF